MEEWQPFSLEYLDAAIDYLESLESALVYNGTPLEAWQRRALKHYVKSRLQTILAKIDGGDRLQKP